MLWFVALLCVLFLAVLGVGIFIISLAAADEDVWLIALPTLLISFLLTIATPVTFAGVVIYKALTL